MKENKGNDTLILLCKILPKNKIQYVHIFLDWRLKKTEFI